MKSINLKLTNNFFLTQKVSLFGTVKSNNQSLNYTKSYDFDLSREVLPNAFKFRYASVSNPSLTIDANITVDNSTIQEYVKALNLLNIGFFVSNQDIIYMFSDDYIGILIVI